MDKYSLTHTRWGCKYYLVFEPKYRRQIAYGKIKADVARILSELRKRKGIEIIEAWISAVRNTNSAYSMVVLHMGIRDCFSLLMKLTDWK